MSDISDGSARTVKFEAQLSVAYFETGEPEKLDVRYRVDNASALPIGVLNTAASTAGDPPRPAVRITDGGDLTVAYQLHAPRRLDAAVTQKIYAVRVPPGEHYAGQVSVKLLSAYPDQNAATGLVRPQRVRFCQAYAVHSAERFTALPDNQNIWLTQPGVHASQEILCSEWTQLGRQ